ncbi:MAG TPA: Rieske 2Fe-2S domain-containing protein [Methylomirabilota bacterium]|nr:Rieske 2Fe-2S domain-containing protein [Methylomirabilota bacterium]
MLSREDNELITRVGRSTPMGATLRRYWLPALLTRELPEPDGAPVRVRLLGEDLIAFRDTRGTIGLLDEFCPHRRSSLYFGRNEECGLRCVYHGWKFDVDGRCVDMMNEPADLQFKDKIATTSYSTLEAGGVVWAYLGPPALKPTAPSFAWTRVPASHITVSKVIQESNWVQGVEGGIDTSHAPILHRLLTSESKRPGFKPDNPFVRGKAPKLELDVTDYGYRYAGVRPLDEASIHVRTYHFILPFHQIRPSRSEGGVPLVAGHMWVPIDDETTMVYNWEYSVTEPLTAEDRLERRLGNGPHDVDQKTFRSIRNKRNDYMLDRCVQKTETFTGIDGINTQDRAIQEGMGPIVDRSKEHLGPADRAIIQARRLLLEAVKTVTDGGVPRGVEPSYSDLAAAEAVLPKGTDWRDAELPAGSQIHQTV